jgi:hypothetical protein
MTRLVTTPVPLLHASPVESNGAVVAGVEASTRLRLTAAGRHVLDGLEDQVALNGVDRWIGGVHLSGGTAHWRWDEGIESVISRP